MDYSKPTNGYSANNYFSFFKGLVLIYKPRQIVEIGIGEGYTLAALTSGVKENGFGHICAYDLFEKWPYFHRADYADIRRRFQSNSVEIRRGDFLEVYKVIADNSVDLFDIDISLDGSLYKFFFSHYLKKLSRNGIAILEGGSRERDKVHWMKRYRKKRIYPVLLHAKKINYFTFKPFPSLTIIERSIS